MASQALCQLGLVLSEAVTLIKEAKVNLARIQELEEITKHDAIAFTRCVDER